MIKFHSNIDVAVDAPRVREIINDIKADPMGDWYDLPENYNRDEFENIKSAATKIQSNSKYLVCIGIGGSYLGHRAIIEALHPESPTKVVYAGNSLSTRELSRLLETIDDADFSINIISKSGTTTEPAVAFRLLKAKLQKKYGDAARDRIFATTDAKKGALYEEAVAENYTRFIVPDNIGGRYSVLTAVGLLPLAVAGVDIEKLMSGANAERIDNLSTKNPAEDADNIEDSQGAAAKYATLRADLLKKGYDVEVLASFEPCMQYFEEWWKQLFGESEGKEKQGIFPASVIYTTDLHSLGQYLQDGRRNIFETMLRFTKDVTPAITVPELEEDLDGLKYLEGRTLDFLNTKALEATIAAHREGGIPVSEITVPTLDEISLGALIYFFELTCAISAKLSGVNPFDQPGVEAYKHNMFHLLGKPGF